MTLMLNGVDVSKWFNIYGVNPGYEKVEGPNSGTSQGGTQIVDLVATKDSVTYEGNGMTQEAYGQLVGICKNATISVYRDDPYNAGQFLTQTMIPTLSGGHQVPMRGQIFYDEITLTVREQ